MWTDAGSNVPGFESDAGETTAAGGGAAPANVARWILPYLKPQIGHSIGFQAPISTNQHPISMVTK